MREELEIAYRAWQQSRTRSICKCHTGHVDNLGRSLPDSEVCERERLWRNYVRVRDGNPNWMTGERLYQ